MFVPVAVTTDIWECARTCQGAVFPHLSSDDAARKVGLCHEGGERHHRSGWKFLQSCWSKGWQTSTKILFLTWICTAWENALATKALVDIENNVSPRARTNTSIPPKLLSPTYPSSYSGEESCCAWELNRQISCWLKITLALAPTFRSFAMRHSPRQQQASLCIKIDQGLPPLTLKVLYVLCFIENQI